MESAVQELPRVIHRVWVGSRPPLKIQDNWEMWNEAYPNITQRTWQDDDLDSLKAAGALKKLPHFKDPRTKSDFVRFAVLLEYGGMYVDSDAVPLADEATLEKWLETPWLAGHCSNPYKGKTRLINSTFCIYPQDPFMKTILATGFLNAFQGMTDAHKLAGAHMMMDLYDESLADTLPVRPVFDFRYEARAHTLDIDYLKEVAHPDAPFIFLGV